jgi:Ca2+-binding RTX toxin-like protein
MEVVATSVQDGRQIAQVSYIVTAEDNVDDPVGVTCTPASGSTFPIGTTTVNCEATDAAGNRATASFTITVIVVTCEGQTRDQEGILTETATILGTPGNDILSGTEGRDVIAALEGNDRIDALGGDDLICGDAGNDVMFGGAGNDDMFGGDGDDEMHGEDGDDLVDGGQGVDLGDGGPGTDIIRNV